MACKHCTIMTIPSTHTLEGRSESVYIKCQDPVYLPRVSKIFKNVCFEEDNTPEETHLVYTELTVSLDT